MTIDKFEAFVSTMTKYIVVAIVMVAALYAVRFDAFAATAIETTTTEETESMYTEEIYVILDENHAVEVYCEFSEGYTWVYTYKFDSVDDYINDNYCMVAVKLIDMRTSEIVTDWASPWSN